MTDIKQLKERLKAQLDNKKVAEILSFLGIEITRNYKFLNDSSMSIRADGLIHDFNGTGFTGDILDYLMQEKSISFIDAVKYVADCLGVDYE